MTVHRCHVPRCDTECPPKHLMCAECWREVPPPEKLAVHRTLKRRGPRADASWAPWVRATYTAISSVMKARGDDEDSVSIYVDHSENFAELLEER